MKSSLSDGLNQSNNEVGKNGKDMSNDLTFMVGEGINNIGDEIERNS